MFYSIRHVTDFRYSAPISASIMEVRMQPRSEGPQRRHNFHLYTDPPARVMAYRDHLGNTIHHFDVPGRHSQLTITATSLVGIQPLPPVPETLERTDWQKLDTLTTEGDYWEMLNPSHFARPTLLLRELARELQLERRDDPLTTLRELNASIRQSFDYVPRSTKVNSPIDDALSTRQGVCQDFAHVMIALVRELRIPCRYVSGYLFHRREDHDVSAADATHAWVEALLPGLGWVGFDPTNNLVAGERHIRTAIGRDYADVPPTRGVFKGDADTELAVAVQVTPAAAPPSDEDEPPVMNWIPLDPDDQEQQQQQNRESRSDKAVYGS